MIPKKLVQAVAGPTGESPLRDPRPRLWGLIIVAHDRSRRPEPRARLPVPRPACPVPRRGCPRDGRVPVLRRRLRVPPRGLRPARPGACPGGVMRRHRESQAKRLVFRRHVLAVCVTHGAGSHPRSCRRTPSPPLAEEIRIVITQLRPGVGILRGVFRPAVLGIAPRFHSASRVFNLKEARYG